MEKTKKSTKTTATPAKKTAVKAEVKAEKVKKAQPVAEVVETQPVVEVAPKAKSEVITETKEPVKKTTLNQELNLVIGLFSLITIITFCFTFQGGDTKILGWELLLHAGKYSGVFKGLMILYVIA